jgi:hypothetical protein
VISQPTSYIVVARPYVCVCCIILLAIQLVVAKLRTGLALHSDSRELIAMCDDSEISRLGTRATDTGSSGNFAR